MPGEDGAADSPAKKLTLPFKPPEFDWNASNLYSQFKLFKTKLNLHLRELTKITLGMQKLVQS